MTPLNSEIQALWGHATADFFPSTITTFEMSGKARVRVRAEEETPAARRLTRRSRTQFVASCRHPTRARCRRQWPLDHS